LGWHPVAVVRIYTQNNIQKNTNKQHTEQHIIDTKQYMEQHNSRIVNTKLQLPRLIPVKNFNIIQFVTRVRQRILSWNNLINIHKNYLLLCKYKHYTSRKRDFKFRFIRNKKVSGLLSGYFGLEFPVITFAFLRDYWFI
jgi:hypothetical protein